MILATELTKDLDNAPFNLKFSFACHQWREGHATEVTAHGDLQALGVLCDRANLIKLLCETGEFNLLKLVRVAEIEPRVQVLADGPEQVRERLIRFLITGHDTNRRFGHLNTALNAHLDVSSTGRRLFLHVRPDIAAEMAFEQRVTCLIELRVGDDWDALGQRARNLDAILVELLLSHQVGQVLYHEDDWL